MYKLEGSPLLKKLKGKNNHGSAVKAAGSPHIIPPQVRAYTSRTIDTSVYTPAKIIPIFDFILININTKYFYCRGSCWLFVDGNLG